MSASNINQPTAIIRAEGVTVKFRDEYDGGAFSARLLTSSDRITLTVTPKRPMTFEELSVVGFAEITDSDRIFMNGYQSWTDSREWSKKERMRGIEQIPAPVVRKYNFDKYGDYGFTHYSPRRGTLHGWTYAYVRDGYDFRLCGSLSEREGFTRIVLLTDKQRIKLSRECEGAVYCETFKAIDCALLNGTEDEVFDRWQEMMDLPKRGLDRPALIQGYTSWYRHYQDISEEKLCHDLEAILSSGMTTDIFQIDDGYQTAVGDWLSVDGTKFPNGVKPIAERIHDEGLKAGLWLAPFVCEKNSSLMELHPDWILKDEKGKPLAAGCNWSGSYALDIYNEEVREYLRKVFDTVLNDWGFDLVKLDFLYAACIRPAGGKSRGQIMCEAMDFLRELCGDKLILGCGVPLGAAFGKVDFCRIGCDVGLSWNDSLVMQQTHRERVSTKNSMLNSIFRRQLNGRFFGNDPDVFLLREDNIKLANCQKQSLAVINHLYGSVLFTSDDVGTYSDRQRKLLSQARGFIGGVTEYADFTDGVVTLRINARGRHYTLRLDTTDGRFI